jgi:hypothetical protein
VSKAEEYAKKLAEFEKKTEEEAKLFNINNFLNITLEKHVDGLGIVRYGHLSFGDIVKLNSISDDLERGVTAIALMLSKADNTITVEKVKALPAFIFKKLSDALAEDIKMGFFSTGNQSEDG